MTTITLHAPAKINLALSAGPATTDNMHPICSWMVNVNLFDDLTVMRLPPDRLSRYAILWHGDARQRSEINWSITRDLAVRAHLALEAHVGRYLPVQMKLEKRIPVGSGLGGGSADAAAMLHAVNHLYDLQLDEKTLTDIACELGSDVGFFIRGGSAIVEGLGERITPLDHNPKTPVPGTADLPEIHAVLILAEHVCPTGEVYRAFDLLGTQPKLRSEEVARLARTSSPGADALFNDLAEAALSVAPALGDLIEEIKEIAERPVHITGSGSGLFVLCDDEMHAEALAQQVEKRAGVPAMAVRSCRPNWAT